MNSSISVSILRAPTTFSYSRLHSLLVRIIQIYQFLIKSKRIFIASPVDCKTTNDNQTKIMPLTCLKVSGFCPPIGCTVVCNELHEKDSIHTLYESQDGVVMHIGTTAGKDEIIKIIKDLAQVPLACPSLEFSDISEDDLKAVRTSTGLCAISWRYKPSDVTS